jgi:hypothetical protein
MDESKTIRVSVEEAATLLGIEKGSVKKRIQRGKLRSEKDASGTIWVYLDRSETVRDRSQGQSETDRDELVSELRDRVRSLERRLDEEKESRRRADTIIAQLSRANEEQARTIRGLEAPSATPPAEPVSSETATVSPEDTPPRSSTGGPETATEGLSEAEPSLLWESIGVVILSILLALVIVLVLGVSTGSAWPVYALLGSTALAWVVFPAVFGFLLGRKVRSLRFWRNVAPVAAILGLVSFIAGRLLGTALTGNKSVFFGVFFAAIPSFVYIFAAVLGNALRRRKREKLVEERPSEFPPEAAPGPQGWTPRQQAFVGLAGTTISALIGLISTILTVLAKT